MALNVTYTTSTGVEVVGGYLNISRIIYESVHPMMLNFEYQLYRNDTYLDKAPIEEKYMMFSYVFPSETSLLEQCYQHIASLAEFTNVSVYVAPEPEPEPEE